MKTKKEVIEVTNYELDELSRAAFEGGWHAACLVLLDRGHEQLADCLSDFIFNNPATNDVILETTKAMFMERQRRRESFSESSN